MEKKSPLSNKNGCVWTGPYYLLLFCRSCWRHRRRCVSYPYISKRVLKRIFLKTNLTKFAFFSSESFLSPRSSKITVTKEMEKERRRRGKSNGCTLSFHNDYLGDNVFKNPAGYHILLSLPTVVTVDENHVNNLLMILARSLHYFKNKTSTIFLTGSPGIPVSPIVPGSPSNPIKPCGPCLPMVPFTPSSP